MRESRSFELLLSQARVVREKLSFSRGEVKGDPSKHYSWIHNSESRINFYEGLGYQIVKDPEVKTNWLKEDGTHRWGDSILMCVDKDFKQALDMDTEISSVESLEGSRESFLAFAKSRGVPVVDNSLQEA